MRDNERDLINSLLELLLGIIESSIANCDMRSFAGLGEFFQQNESLKMKCKSFANILYSEGYLFR